MYHIEAASQQPYTPFISRHPSVSGDNGCALVNLSVVLRAASGVAQQSNLGVTVSSTDVEYKV